jgi:acyl-coenzyme A thioesterase PaaI-like protein
VPSDAHPMSAQVFAEFTDSVRRLLNAAASTSASEEVLRDVKQDLLRSSEQLKLGTKGRDVWDAVRDTLPSRGRLTCPIFEVESVTNDAICGYVTFDRCFEGKNGAVHGGAIAMLFDEVLGSFVNRPPEPRSRTVQLDVTYHHVTPIGVPLRLEAAVTKHAGRKQHLTSVITCDETVCASASALFVRLHPGQT